jgi:hypothetical protein
MLRRLRPHLSYANVAATLALVIAVGGGSAYAAQRIRASQIGFHAVTASKVNFNAITTSKVRNGSLAGKDVRDNAITTQDVRNGTLRFEDFAAGQLPPGPKGDPGAAAAALNGTVSATGTLVSGTGVTAITAGAADATYTVTFDRDVSKCSVIGTVATSGDTDGGTVTGAPGDSVQQVTFRTRNFSGDPAQRPFSFALFC